jgi:hypothetical protein
LMIFLAGVGPAGVVQAVARWNRDHRA